MNGWGVGAVIAFGVACLLLAMVSRGGGVSDPDVIDSLETSVSRRGLTLLSRRAASVRESLFPLVTFSLGWVWVRMPGVARPVDAAFVVRVKNSHGVTQEAHARVRGVPGVSIDVEWIPEITAVRDARVPLALPRRRWVEWRWWTFGQGD